MSRANKTLGPAYFDAIYAADSDPWRFASSAYELDKYAATLAVLPKARYASAFEIGCSIGVLTSALAPRCDALLAVDAAAAPLIEARRRCAELSNVQIERMFVPGQWPNIVFDLILLSEIVYYLCAEDVVRLAARALRSLAFEGDVALVHWTGATDYPLSADEAVELFIETMGRFVRVQRQDRSDAFRLDIVRRC